MLPFLAIVLYFGISNFYEDFFCKIGFPLNLSQILTGSWDGELKLFDIVSESSRTLLQVFHNSFPPFIIFSPTQKYPTAVPRHMIRI